MKKSTLTGLISLLSFYTAFAATYISATTVSGHWTLAGSPYYISNDINIDSGKSLVIDPGVQVIFRDVYHIQVSGSLVADGTINEPIVFDIEDTTGWHIDAIGVFDGGWWGIQFMPYTSSVPDISSVSYCHFHHLKWSAVTVDRPMHMHHCEFSNNKGGALTLKGAGTGNFEINDCAFFNNVCSGGSALWVFNATAAWFIHNNDFYDNISVGGAVISVTASTVLFSQNKVFDNAVPPNADSTSNAKIIELVSTTVPCYAVVSENKIYNNKCNLAAAIFCGNIVGDFYRNYICNNYHLNDLQCAATCGGGGMYLKGGGNYGFGNYAVYTVRDNIIANNYSALYGGGIGVWQAKVLIANNTIVNNKAPRGGGIDFWMALETTVCVRNNILYGNVNEQMLPGNINLMRLQQLNFKYDHNWSTYPFSSNVQVFPTATGSLNLLGDTSTNIVGSDPGLVSPTLTANYAESALGADFRLTAGSPCINKGIDSAAVVGSADYEGNNRFSGSSVDIGAYEYSAAVAGTAPTLAVDTMFKYCCAAIAPLLSINNTRADKFSVDIYPNPASSVVFIKVPETNGAVCLTNATGKQVAVKQVTGALVSFDLTQLPRGFYSATWYGANDKKATRTIVLE